MTKRVFVSFDFDNDKFLKDSVVGQSKLPDSPFSISDWSLKEEQEEDTWKKKARARIKRSDIVLVMVGTETHKAPGVLSEVDMAREEDIKIVQIKGYSDKKCPSVSNAGKMYNWTWDNLKKLLS
ncbi:TIR domain-containing protein [Thalassospira sp. SM2505]